MQHIQLTILRSPKGKLHPLQLKGSVEHEISVGDRRMFAWMGWFYLNVVYQKWREFKKDFQVVHYFLHHAVSM